LFTNGLSVRLKDAWTFATALDNEDSWILLAKTAMHHLDLSIGSYLELLATFPPQFLIIGSYPR